MNKLVITGVGGLLGTFVFKDGKASDLCVEEDPLTRKELHTSDIVIGRVENIVPSLNAAFIDIGMKENAYYSMKDSPLPLCGLIREGTLTQGDLIPVQVEKEPVKTKGATVTAALTLTGRFCVCLAGKQGLHLSKKITDPSVRSRLETEVKTSPEEILKYGWIIRTNASEVSFVSLAAEMKELSKKMDEILKIAPHRNKHFRLYQSAGEYAEFVRDFKGGLDEILTDRTDVYEELLHTDLSDADLRFYEDDMISLCKLYSCESVLKEALEKRVWLKSGAYLVIEPTEALTVIDVNTGKSSGAKREKGAPEKLYKKINYEAAQEIARQLRLRNLSGMILVDFIDVPDPDYNRDLLEFLKDCCKDDPGRAVVVDMTALHLCEMTRKRTRRPLHEVYRKVQLSQPEKSPDSAGCE